MTLQKKAVGKLYFALIGLIIAVPLMVQFIAFGVEEGREASQLLGFYADDLAVLMESLQTAPGDIVITYPIEGDYTVLLKENEVEVVHSVGILKAKRSFHTLPGIRVEQGEAKGVVVIAKQGNVLRLQAQDSESVNCPKALIDPKSVSVQIRPSVQAAGLSTQDLELIQHTLEQSLDRAKLLVDSQASINIVLYSGSELEGQSLSQGITLLRSSRSGEEELNYQGLVCSVLSNMPSSYSVQELKRTYETQDYVLLINFNMDEEQARNLLTQRNDLANSLVQAIGQ